MKYKIQGLKKFFTNVNELTHSVLLDAAGVADVDDVDESKGT